MKKIMVVMSVLLVVLLAGCGLVERFQQAEEQYLETRVSELLEETPEEAVAVEPVETVEAEEKAAEETEEVVLTTEPVVTEEPEPELTEEAETDETPEVTEEASPEPTVESDDPAVYLGEPAWVDEMDKPEYWPVGSDNFTSASFEDGAMKFTALSETNGWRIASTGELANFYVETTVKMGACKDTDGFGFIFRVPKDAGYNRGYLYGITCDGRYSLRLWDGASGENGQMEWLQYYKESELISSGKDETNRIGVMAVDDRLVLFVNGEKIDEIVDERYNSGYFGLYINRDKTENLTVYVDTVQYWTDPVEK
jgi:uncharacterized protein YceK